ncbi:substance-K receptor isoform X2 [Nematostella vectensis]|nr:substance-K receptor isoform X2 [Nematostella vectensis]XP_048578572.1 substance-K receptor isoform X2 [Nematostella vectensis]XP_048578573.1 substance-K receptor isoform X2 [Nematostella vectensis]XP_048578574.1 substance-K receptor isoform X2 [Nematostella vectensis]XP_048578575.1 substance-K receptor isoform X2 [Nematostella vectensis]XP_048578576.1 substance-K receptor isoform X2 [Nematostella vectensis]
MNLNGSANSTLSARPPRSTGCHMTLDDDTRIGLTVAYVFVFITAITANSLVIHVVRTQKKMKVSFNFLVVNMAVADTVDALFAIPLNIAYLYAENQWFSGFLGIIVCKITRMMVLVAILVSIATLSVITVERYLATTQVLKRPLTLTSVKRLIAAIWVISGLAAVNEAVKHHVTFTRGAWRCMPIITKDWQRQFMIEFIIKFMVTYAVPLLTMAILYSIIVCLLWKRKTLGEQIDENDRRVQIQRRSVIQKLVIIVSLFAVCWLPVHVNHFLGTFDRKAYICLPQWVVLGFYWLAHANTAINPLIYLMLTKHSRALFKSSITGKRNGSMDKNRNHTRKTTLFGSWKRGSRKSRSLTKAGM